MTRIQIRRGTDANHTNAGVTGEPIWTDGATPNDKRLWIADGTLPKGIQVGWQFAPQPGWISAWYYNCSSIYLAAISGTVTINFAFYSPVFIGGGERNDDGVSYQSFHAEVTGTQAAKNFKLGLYYNDNGQPGDQISESGDISTASTGIKTWSTSNEVIAGWYWAAFNTDANTATFRLTDNLAAAGPVMGSNAAGIGIKNVYFQAATYSGTPLPSTAAVTNAGSFDVPAITVRAA